MSKIILSCFLVLAASASASAGIRESFLDASGPSLQGLEGWYAGRCYWVDQLGRPAPQLLAVETREAQAGSSFMNEGRVVERKTKVMLFSIAKNRGYDRPELFDELYAGLERELASQVERNFSTNQVSDSIYFAGSLTSVDGGHSRYELRQGFDYLYARVHSIRTGNEPVYCYFFKKLK